MYASIATANTGSSRTAFRHQRRLNQLAWTGPARLKTAPGQPWHLLEPPGVMTICTPPTIQAPTKSTVCEPAKDKLSSVNPRGQLRPTGDGRPTIWSASVPHQGNSNSKLGCAARSFSIATNCCTAQTHPSVPPRVGFWNSLSSSGFRRAFCF